jgi:hypothetical protein
MLSVYIDPIQNLGTLLCSTSDQFPVELDGALSQGAARLSVVAEADMPIDLYSLACDLLDQR